MTEFLRTFTPTEGHTAPPETPTYFIIKAGYRLWPVSLINKQWFDENIWLFPTL